MLPETLNDAYVEAVKALGGSKAVGVALWPAKGVEAAQRQVLACLNPERAEKLGPDEALHIERLARAAGCHVIAEWRNASLGYAAPVPVEPRDEAAELRRQVLAMGRDLQRRLTRLEELDDRETPVRLRAAS